MAPVKADARNPEYGIHDCLTGALLPLRQMDRMQVQGVMLVLLMLAAGLSVKLPRGQRRGRRSLLPARTSPSLPVPGTQPLHVAARRADSGWLPAVAAPAGWRRPFAAFLRAPFALQPAFAAV